MNRIAWAQSERKARAKLRPHLKDYIALAAATHRVVEASAVAVQTAFGRPLPHPIIVQVRLLIAASRDLRVLTVAAGSGYSSQALSLLANVFELAHSIAYIGDDTERAAKWEHHDAERNTYPPANERDAAIRTTLRALYVPEMHNTPAFEDAVQAQHKLYSRACMAKHGNPLMFRSQGTRLDGGTLAISHGPYVSRASIAQARIALFHGSRLLLGATIVFGRERLENNDDLAMSFVRRVDRVSARLSALVRRGPADLTDAT